MTIEFEQTKAPSGWEPYTEHTEQIGTAIVKLPRPNATQHDLLIGAGFAPDEWQISGPINTRKWMRYDGEWLYYYKFSVVAGESPEAVQEHVDDLVKRIRRRKPVARTSGTEKDAWGLVCSDWQIGKAESGIGTAQTVDRVVEMFDLAALEVKNLRRVGHAIPHGAMLGLGDILEGCHGNYPGQPFMVDRTRRDQGKITRELLTYGIETLSPLFDRFTLACVGGNHGEHRNDGKVVTDDSDNDDVAVFEAVKEAFDRGGQEFEWLIPYDELSMMVRLGGVDVGIAHGHKFGKGSTPQQKAYEWFKGQDFGFGPVRGAQILLTAHFHHFLAHQAGQRWLYQAPAMDPGSKWHTDRTGEHSGPAGLAMRFDSDHPFGHDNVRLLAPSK